VITSDYDNANKIMGQKCMQIIRNLKRRSIKEAQVNLKVICPRRASFENARNIRQVHGNANIIK